MANASEGTLPEEGEYPATTWIDLDYSEHGFKGRVVIDGKDISSAVSAVTVDMSAKSGVPLVILQLAHPFIAGWPERAKASSGGNPSMDEPRINHLARRARNLSDFLHAILNETSGDGFGPRPLSVHDRKVVGDFSDELDEFVHWVTAEGLNLEIERTKTYLASLVREKLGE